MDPLRHAYAALRGVLKDLGQRQGCPHAPFPELLDDRLCCVEASDGKTFAFTGVVDYYCEGDPSVALWLLDRLRRLDPELGIPSWQGAGELDDGSSGRRRCRGCGSWSTRMK